MYSFKSKTKLTPDKYLTDKEVAEFERVIIKFYKNDFRNCLLMELALRTGCRAQELLNMKKSDINEEIMSIYIHTLKGGADRDIPLPSQLFAKVRKWVVACKTENLFDMSYVYLRQIWLNYRPIEKKFHSLRHTAAIRFYKKCRNIHTVKTILGHTDINSTMVYLDFVESNEKIRKLI